MSGNGGPSDAGDPHGDDPSSPGPEEAPRDEEALLRRELADLEAFLEEHGDEAGDRPLDVDVEVRRRKAEVLRDVLDEAGDDRDAHGRA